MTHSFILAEMSRVPTNIFQNFLERVPLINVQREKQEDVREVLAETMMFLEEN